MVNRQNRRRKRFFSGAIRLEKKAVFSKTFYRITKKSATKKRRKPCLNKNVSVSRLGTENRGERLRNNRGDITYSCTRQRVRVYRVHARTVSIHSLYRRRDGRSRRVSLQLSHSAHTRPRPTTPRIPKNAYAVVYELVITQYTRSLSGAGKCPVRVCPSRARRRIIIFGYARRRHVKGHGVVRVSRVTARTCTHVVITVVFLVKRVAPTYCLV